MATADLSAKRGCMADFAAYWRGLRRFYNPRGRATRTELFMLLILSSVFAAIVQLMVGRFLTAELEHAIGLGITALVLVPIPAAAARRFHDMGKSGWFALPVLLLCAGYLWNVWRDIEAGPQLIGTYSGNEPTLWILYALIGVMFSIILMQPPKDTNNAYGPDPRPAPKVI